MASQHPALQRTQSMVPPHVGGGAGGGAGFPPADDAETESEGGEISPDEVEISPEEISDRYVTEAESHDASRGPTGRHWVFTIHCDSANSAEQELRRLWRPSRTGKMRYIVCQQEIGAGTGRLHWQGYCQFTQPVRSSGVRTALACPWAWVKPARGNADQARAYCTKDDTRAPNGLAYEDGQMAVETQGKRNDLADGAAMIASGKRMAEVAESNPALYIRYHRGLREYERLVRAKTAATTFRTVSVHVYTGPAGCGKSKWAFDTFPVEDTYSLTVGASDQTWWDGYEGQSVLLIDDFTGTGLKWGFFLRVLDGYPLQVPVKGAMVWLEVTTIVITSNYAWNEWYEVCQSEEGMMPLRRRIQEVRCVSADGAEPSVDTRSPSHDWRTRTGYVPIPSPTPFGERRAIARGFNPGAQSESGRRA